MTNLYRGLVFWWNSKSIEYVFGLIGIKKVWDSIKNTMEMRCDNVFKGARRARIVYMHVNAKEAVDHIFFH
jgi:hypothetical protein